MSKPTGIVIVSHSGLLARGLADLLQQMAEDVIVTPIGGFPAGSDNLGTDFDAIAGGISSTLSRVSEAVVFADLGSAVLSTRNVLDLHEDEYGPRVRIATAPFVEGAVLAAVAAQTGKSAAEVVEAASEAGQSWTAEPESVSDAELGLDHHEHTQHRADVTIVNELGLHARPAALIAKMAGGFDARVLINGADATSILAIMRLAAQAGQIVTVEAEGSQAQQALAAIVTAIAEGFGEPISSTHE